MYLYKPKLWFIRFKNNQTKCNFLNIFKQLDFYTNPANIARIIYVYNKDNFGVFIYVVELTLI